MAEPGDVDLPVEDQPISNRSFNDYMEKITGKLDTSLATFTKNLNDFKFDISKQVSDLSADNKVQIDDMKQRLEALEREKITMMTTQKVDNDGVESKVKSQTEAITGLEDRLARTEHKVLTLQTPIATPQSAGNESGGTGQPMLSSSSRTTPQVFKVRSPVLPLMSARSFKSSAVDLSLNL